ncbi:MAG: DUF4402 domain-containing protein [Pacificimonas sp.]
MLHFVRLVSLMGLLAVAEPAAACMTCDDGSASALASVGGETGDLRMTLRTGFTFRRTSDLGDVIIDALDGTLPGGASGAPGLIGYISLVGTPGRYVHIDLPRRAVLTTSKGGQLEIESIVLDQQSPLKLDATGRLELSFAGVLQAGISPRPGSYSGDFGVTAEYE